MVRKEQSFYKFEFMKIASILPGDYFRNITMNLTKLIDLISRVSMEKGSSVSDQVEDKTSKTTNNLELTDNWQPPQVKMFKMTF